MDRLVVVTYPRPLALEVRPLEHEAVPEDSVGLGYYYRDRLIARGVVARDAVQAIESLLRSPISVALAATEDSQGNIDGRVCLILPVDPDQLRRQIEDEDDGSEPWKQSVPAPPDLSDEWSDESYEEGRGEGRRPIALLPIGNVIRSAQHRNHPDDVAHDAREMLDNLLEGRARDAVQQAIDDLLDNL